MSISPRISTIGSDDASAATVLLRPRAITTSPGLASPAGFRTESRGAGGWHAPEDPPCPQALRPHATAHQDHI